MQTFRFDNPYETKWLEMQLADLAVALSDTPGLHVSFEMSSVWRQVQKQLSISTFFESYPAQIRLAAQKSDIYLRALGNRRWTDYGAVSRFYEASKTSPCPTFIRQLFCIAEDFRLMQNIVEQRPGTTFEFQERVKGYATWLESNRIKRIREKQWLDVVFTDIYGQLFQINHRVTSFLSDPDEPPEIRMMREWINRCVQALKKSATTEQVVEVVLNQAAKPTFYGNTLSDMVIYPFDMDFSASVSEGETDRTESEFRRRLTPASESMDMSKAASEERREEIEVWHQQQKSEAPGMFLMNLHDNNTTPTVGTGARLGSDEVDSLVVRRGKSTGGQIQEDMGEADGQTEANLEGLVTRDVDSVLSAEDVQRRPLQRSMHECLLEWHEETHLAQRRLLRVFDEVLMHRMQMRSDELRHGRLSKHLTRIVYDNHARLFYRRSIDDRRFDVAVQVLVDCSGSMYGRLEIAKPYLYLLHEVMKQRQISHDICGFWEDGEQGSLNSTKRMVTKFLHVISFEECLRAGIAAYIDQLEPQLDNRDGFAIRQMGQRLAKRTERQKWLWVISDGEPAADDYRDAIIDTKNAIRELRQQGIHVVHLCMADGTDSADIDALKQLYGKGAIIVPNAKQLPKVMEQTLQQMIKETTF